jgi:hypothetical protein
METLAHDQDLDEATERAGVIARLLREFGSRLPTGTVARVVDAEWAHYAAVPVRSSVRMLATTRARDRLRALAAARPGRRPAEP